jgi:hypothetical protein
MRQCKTEQWDVISATQALLGDTAEGRDLPWKEIP